MWSCSVDWKRKSLLWAKWFIHCLYRAGANPEFRIISEGDYGWEATIYKDTAQPSALRSPVLIYVLGYAEELHCWRKHSKAENMWILQGGLIAWGNSVWLYFVKDYFAIRTVTIELVLVKLKSCICFVFECQIISYLLASACYIRTGGYRFWSHLYQPRLGLLCTTTASGQHFPVWPSHSVSKIFLYDFKKYFSLNFRDRMLLLSKYHFLGPL